MNLLVVIISRGNLVTNHLKDPNKSDENLCLSKKILIYPKHLIINSHNGDDVIFDEEFTSSYIEGEVCLNEKSSCHEKDDNSTVKHLCRQRFIGINLMMKPNKDDSSNIQTFQIPTHCQCTTYRRKLKLKLESDQYESEK
jgi:hypothetical protein